MSETLVPPTRPAHQLDHPPGVPTGGGRSGAFVWKMLTTTDHKLIGILYISTCLVFFGIGGLMALLIRAELFLPGMQFLSNEQYNQLFTMHGTVMLLFYGTPIVIGIG
ncbi:cytochrome ubiquinol oxidase subunit I, partial [Dietzia sp. SLG510A3-30A2]|nr:cytochrome ubiquinol oxidase subunit I [Dietzia sp. SLG510A3-30A2]